VPKERSFDNARHKLKRLVDKSPNFAAFQEALVSFRRFYLGDPMPPEMRTWTWKEFQQFYEENKGHL
jgi:hypothetical protein